jgi:hypothetical protein
MLCQTLKNTFFDRYFLQIYKLKQWFVSLQQAYLLWIYESLVSKLLNNRLTKRELIVILYSIFLIIEKHLNKEIILRNEYTETIFDAGDMPHWNRHFRWINVGRACWRWLTTLLHMLHETNQVGYSINTYAKLSFLISIDMFRMLLNSVSRPIEFPMED